MLFEKIMQIKKTLSGLFSWQIFYYGRIGRIKLCSKQKQAINVAPLETVRLLTS